MKDFYEIDFLPVGETTSGDAITMRYRVNGEVKIHLVDGGYKNTSETLISHVNKYYAYPDKINSVLVTHSDRDHAGGLIEVINSFEIDCVWMNRPWLYADELVERFSRYTNADSLRKKLKEAYPVIAEIEEICEQKDIPIYEALQGKRVDGHIKILAPSKQRYLDLIVESDKTPQEKQVASVESFMESAFKSIVNFVKSAWGVENFPEEGTSAENEMSVIQLISICEQNILLTGDAGRDALNDAADYRDNYLDVGSLDKIQVPHHGSRRNVSTEVLDRWLGKRLVSSLPEDEFKYVAVVSAAKDDEDHPRKSVIRAFIHRASKVIQTKGSTVCISKNAPRREGWSAATSIPYPEEEEQ